MAAFSTKLPPLLATTGLQSTAVGISFPGNLAASAVSLPHSQSHALEAGAILAFFSRPLAVNVRSRRRQLLRCGDVSGRRALADNFDCVLLDCDGVLWRGDEPIEGSTEAVQRMKAAGKRLYFITNASARSRREVAERISRQLGAPVAADEVVTSGSVVAAVAASCGVKSAFVIGAEGLREEMQLAGVEAVNPRLSDHFDETSFCAVAESLPAVGAVVVGHDEDFSYTKLALASVLLQRGGTDCLLLGTNPDVGNRAPSGYLIPEAGSLIPAVEAASGRKARVVGKPSADVILQLLQKTGFDPARVLMVGDRLDTDIRFGHAGGVRTCLVLTGVSTRADVEVLPPDWGGPDYIRGSLAEVVK